MHIRTHISCIHARRYTRTPPHIRTYMYQTRRPTVSHNSTMHEPNSYTMNNN